MRKQAIVIGTGFFALSAFNAVYDSFLPLLLRNFVSNLALIGFLMTIDNYLGLLFQPWWGSHSDGARGRFGRRVPQLLMGQDLPPVPPVRQRRIRSLHAQSAAHIRARCVRA